VPASDVIVLPNNSNIILAAQQAQALSDKRVRVIPTKTVPQGVSALLAYNYGGDLDDIARSMERSIEDVVTIEITTAVRDVSLNGLTVEEGQIIGLLDGDLVVAGPEIEAVVQEVLQQIDSEEMEILTLYYGETVEQEQAEALAQVLSGCYPDLEIEVVQGGQPHYHYIISVE
jgi:hypothetical protein